MASDNVLGDIVLWGVCLGPIIFVVIASIVAGNGSTNTVSPPSPEQKKMEQWHRDITLFGDPSPWDDDHYR